MKKLAIITRNALQNRFSLTANSVSTKYDLATLFLNDSGYATTMTNAAFPDVFRLTQAEADAILNTPAAENKKP